MPSNRRKRRASYRSKGRKTSRDHKSRDRSHRRKVNDDVTWDTTIQGRLHSPRTTRKLTSYRSTNDDTSAGHTTTGVSEGGTTRPLQTRLARTFRRLLLLRDTSSSTSASTKTSASGNAQHDPTLESRYATKESSTVRGKWYWKNQVPLGMSSRGTSGLFKRPTTKNSVFAVLSAAIVVLCSGSLLYVYANWSNERLGRAQHKAPSPEVISRKDIDTETLMPTNDLLQAPGIVVAKLTTTYSNSSAAATQSVTPPNETLSTSSNRTESISSPSSTAGTPFKQSSRGLCVTRFCVAHTAVLNRFIDWTVDPCSDFYGFVCPAEWPSHTAVSSDARLSDQVDRVLFRSFSEHMGAGAHRKDRRGKPIALMEDCWKAITPRSSRREFHELLNDVGLSRWPYKNNKDQVDVWKVAATLIRDLNLDTLMSVRIDEYVTSLVGVVIVMNEPDLLFHQHATKDRRIPRWYRSALVSSFAMFCDCDVNSTVKGVQSFVEKLLEFTSSRGQEDFSANRFRLAAVGSYSVYKPFLSLVFRGLLTVRDKTKVLVKSDRYLRALKSLLQMTKSSDVLNYMGFRVLLHVSPLMGEECREFSDIRMRQVSGLNYVRNWPRWKRCLRVLEPLFQDLYIFTYARYVATKVDESRIASFASDVKSQVFTALDRLPWMASKDKAESKNLLASLQVRVFYPKTISKLQERVRHAIYKTPVPGRFLYSYKEYVKKYVVSSFSATISQKGPRISRNFWKGSVFTTHPLFDSLSHTIYVPMASLDLAQSDDEDVFAVQVPGIATKLIVSFFQSMHPRSHPFGKVEWGLNTSLSVQDIELCHTMQYNNVTNEMAAEKLRASLTTEYNFLDNAAVSPAYEVFMKYLKDHGIGEIDTGGLRNLTTEHLFYILYAHASCEEGNGEMIWQDLQGDTYGKPRLRVNIPLQNSERFARLWNCPANSLMNPVRKCPMWVPGA